LIKGNLKNISKKHEKADGIIDVYREEEEDGKIEDESERE
jgi:hypothetical protein